MFLVLFVIICAVVGFIIGFRDFCSVLEGVFGMFAGSLVGVLLYFAIAGISISFTQPQTETEMQEIAALADNSRYEHYKSGYLICNGNEQLKYTYMYKTDKGLTVKEVKANQSYIRDLSENEQPYVIITTTYYKNIIVGKVITKYEYTFYLPPNSIVTDYKIDLQ